MGEEEEGVGGWCLVDGGRMVDTVRLGAWGRRRRGGRRRVGYRNVELLRRGCIESNGQCLKTLEGVSCTMALKSI